MRGAADLGENTRHDAFSLMLYDARWGAQSTPALGITPEWPISVNCRTKCQWPLTYRLRAAIIIVGRPAGPPAALIIAGRRG